MHLIKHKSLENPLMRSFAPTPFEQEWIEKAQALKPILAERARELDEKGSWPEENFKLLTERGFMKLAVPRQYGGHGSEDAGFSFACNAVLEVIASVCGNTAWALQAQFHCIGLIAHLGNEEQKARILGDVAETGARLSSCGSEVRPPKTNVTAVGADGKLSFESDLTPVEGGFLANGNKGFTTMGAAAKYLLFWALAPGTADTDHGVCLVVIEQPNPGIEFLRDWEEAAAIRASASGMAKFSNIFVPWENVIGQPGDFNQIHNYTFEIAYTTIALGCAQGMYDIARETVAERPFLQKDDTIMYALGEMSTMIEATRALWWRAQWLYDQKDWGKAAFTTLQALHSSKETALSVSRAVVDVVGTRAMFKWNPIQRLMRDARMVTLHTRESLIMRTVAQQLLKDEYFPKAKYGSKLPSGARKTWEELSKAWEELGLVK
ncbi:acyl-CoA dehydrogenase family protein [Paraburkholderia bannensis]|uniref:acyl-CoA dehydrogenase family protein n=1 Tax=Paraburkholderia bannensis TaxID=765414 RepID=UPI002AC34451|nr:acyl-CoA dehydrogenase family protein [Paraburkholderia bannensis]